MKALGMIIVILTVVGALNWGLVGLGSLLNYNLNVVNLLVGTWPVVENVVYLLVGVCGIGTAWAHLSGKCGMCEHE